MDGDFAYAARALFIAAVFDVLDGRIARLTKGTSEFGVQYDSLCDLISFGFAPAFMLFKFGLEDLGRVGWVTCFVFLACGALRLARFNVQSSIGKASGDFIGLPIPMAALSVASFVALYLEIQTGSLTDLPWLQGLLYDWIVVSDFRYWCMFIVCWVLSLAMVSNFGYRSHKSVQLKGAPAFRSLVILVIMVALLAIKPELGGFLMTFAYSFSGPFEWLAGWKSVASEEEIFAQPADDES